jgi:hypothetical protein
MAKFKVILNVDEEQLRNIRTEAIGEEEANAESLESAVTAELGWVEQSGISLEAIEDQDAEQGLIDSLLEKISDGDPKAIIAYLRSANEDTLDEMAHGHEFEHEGKMEEIVMWQPLEHFTLRQLAESIGL